MSNRIDMQVEETYAEPVLMERIELFVQRVLSELHINNWELSILFCSDAFMTQLNTQYRNIGSATDVLSFEQGDEYIDEAEIRWFCAGDIVISMDSVRANAAEFAVTVDEELKRVIVHGILHLSGMDHADNSSDEPMLQKQEKLLALLQQDTQVQHIIEDESK